MTVACTAITTRAFKECTQPSAALPAEHDAFASCVECVGIVRYRTVSSSATRPAAQATVVATRLPRTARAPTTATHPDPPGTPPHARNPQLCAALSRSLALL